MDEHSQKVRDDIQQYGWHVVLVTAEDDEPAFGYTVGLFHTFRHPEVILIGQKLETTHAILNNIGDEIKHGAVFDAGTESEAVLEGYSVALRQVGQQWYPEYLGIAMDFYEGEDFPVLQCVWPDRFHRYPWDPACHEKFRQLQPVLDDAQR
jgi:hypothetical protein